MDYQSLALITSGLLVLIACVYLAMGFGWRRGEFVWSGRHPRRLPPELRWRSFAHAFLLIASAWGLATISGAIPSLIPGGWHRSAGIAIATFLGIAALYGFFNGSRWERFVFGPIALLGAALTVWFILP